MEIVLTGEMWQKKSGSDHVVKQLIQKNITKWYKKPWNWEEGKNLVGFFSQRKIVYPILRTSGLNILRAGVCKVCSHWEVCKNIVYYLSTQNGPEIECEKMNTFPA